ncbi:MAG: Uma2 family endonuclease [Micromonosporaceae bacterium]|nr:Uma2 family endonuclease [Micromonosporaceae bacterium]
MTVTVAPEIEPIGREVSPEEYDALPADFRRELVDGVVQMMASPSPLHEDVGDALRIVLRRLVPPHLRVTGHVEIRLADDLRRVPDALVVKAKDYNKLVPRFEPEQVVLAIEVMSPGSKTADRINKPEEYARAGIEHFWRVELEPRLSIHTYWLTGEREYTKTGKFEYEDVVHAPGLGWATVPVAELADEPG